MATTSDARAVGPVPRILRGAAAGLGALFMPPLCLHCEGRRFRATPLCLGCLRKLVRVPARCCPRCGDPACGDGHGYWAEPYDSARFLYRVTPPFSTIAHGFKYRHMRRHVEFLAAPLRRRGDLLRYARGFDALVPVPLHPARRRERGYNQAEAIAAALGRHSGVPVRAGALTRPRATTTQTRLGREERRGNLEGAFACPDPGAVQGSRLLLVDDVFTTGSTVSACARELRRAGCSEVGVFALGRVEKDMPGDEFVRELEAVAAYMA